MSLPITSDVPRLRGPSQPGEGGAGGIPTVYYVEQPAVRRVQIVRGHAVPVRGPVDAAVVLQVELLQAGSASAQTCWALGPLPPFLLCPRADPDEHSLPKSIPGRSARLTGPIKQHSPPGSHSGTWGGATLWGRHMRAGSPGGGSGPAGPPRHSAACCSSRPWAGTPADSGTRWWRDVRASSQETAWGQSMSVGTPPQLFQQVDTGGRAVSSQVGTALSASQPSS